MQFFSKSIFLVLFCYILTLSPALAENLQPRLVLQITVDALRGDLPNRYYERLGAKRFPLSLGQRDRVY